MRPLLLFLIPFVLASCGRTQVSWLSAFISDSENGPKSGPQKPGPDEKLVAWVWTFLETRDDGHGLDEFSLCPNDFSLEGPCPTLNEKCRLNNNLYACWPEGQALIYQGQVVDQAGVGVDQAFVQVGTPLGDFKKRKGVFTDSNGHFLILGANACMPLAFASKEGYLSPQKTPYSSAATKCNFEKWGAFDIKITLVSESKN